MKRYFYILTYLAGIQLLGLFFLFCFRFILYLQGMHYIDDPDADVWLRSTAFVRGVWFDNVVLCYVMLLPLTGVSIAALLGYFGSCLYRVVHIWFIVSYAVLFCISAADLPYFAYFFKHLNSSIFNWVEYGSTTFGMMFTERSYYFPMLLFAGFLVIYIVLARLWLNRFRNRLEKLAGSTLGWPDRAVVLLCSIVMIGGCLFGIRGRMGYNPIRVSAAFYCHNPFLNQLGINPAFNLLRSSIDSGKKENRDIELMDERLAVDYVWQSLGIADTLRESVSLVRPVRAEESPSRKNVVLILMESMSADLLGCYGSTEGVTPFLDSLSRVSIRFDQIYSAGIHTNHGIIATLYSYPALMKRNLMKGAVIRHYSGLPTILRQNGYETLFFMTHESQYDNMNGFLRTNGFNQIYAEENYPSDRVVNSFGVADDFLFEYALPVIRKNAEQGPFFATLLTISNHPPYVVPEWFQSHHTETDRQIVEYADWSLKQFFLQASRESWYENTLFVLVGDHGKLVGDVACEMPQCYNHVPLLIHDPQADSARIIDRLGGQIDIMPTVLGLLNLDYANEGFGIDLLKVARNCIFFTADDAIGCMSKDLFYIYKPADQQELLYRMDRGKVGSRLSTDTTDIGFLRTYAFSMLQTAQRLSREEQKPVRPGI